MARMSKYPIWRTTPWATPRTSLWRCLVCLGILFGFHWLKSIVTYTDRRALKDGHVAGALSASVEAMNTVTNHLGVPNAAINREATDFHSTQEEDAVSLARIMGHKVMTENLSLSGQGDEIDIQEKAVRERDRIWPHLYSFNFTELVQLIAEGESLNIADVSKDLNGFIHSAKAHSSATYENETQQTLQQLTESQDMKKTTEMVHTAYNECTRQLRPRELRWMVWMQKRLADALGADKKCRWWLTHGSAITALRKRTVPWEHDVDIAIIKDDERRCGRLLVESGDFSILDKLYNSKGQPQEKELKKGWFVRYRLNPFVNGRVVYDVHADIHIFTINTVKKHGRKDAYIQQKCTKRFYKTKRECAHRHDYSTVFPLKKYTLRAGFEVNGPADVKKYTDTMYPISLLHGDLNNTDGQETFTDEPIEKNYVTQGRAGVACIKYAHAVGWVQDYLLDGFWTYINRPP
ncbi:hypothetical protein SARC_05560 [Sphaeroforma arctica JP610]|uniref:Uncharacterized protein n=1 Tax=Sphaeroforma arctica JP610 TaxID=667725 RepID=A0A0L0FZ95_9EUKA|nr:hypothetical protein SARC_05560 [Sphaeroforma arctica JP610]KNC82140.1 hypothetical protein SARC_05560 [Sphaeroforma arctica JP610]|eukprot:XP_014156042.1 hypothetical protein SARC_05560 [Sphaeroforma arctica JP610]